MSLADLHYFYYRLSYFYYRLMAKMALLCLSLTPCRLRKQPVFISALIKTFLHSLFEARDIALLINHRIT